MSRKPVLLAIATTAVGFSGVAVVFTYIAPLLIRIAGFSPAGVSALLFAYGAGSFLSNLAAGKLTDRSMSATVRGVFGGLTGVLVAMPFAAAWQPTAILAVLGLGLGLLATATIAPLQGLILRHAGSAPTLAVAVNVGAFNLGAATGSALGGAIVAAGALRWTGLAGAVLSFSGLPLTYLVLPRTGTAQHTGNAQAFAAGLFDGFFRADQRRWGQAYVRGLLLDGRRKSVEPMAARLGEDGNPQALAHFITSSPWDPAHVRARLAWRMHEAIGPEALIIDDTGFLKDGDASACVSRQYTGIAGKVTNCQVGVSLHLARDHASAAVNWRLFLPASWDPASADADADKVARRTRCGIPAQVGHVEKWQLALDMIDETRSWGIDVPLVVADAGYGDAAAFRLGLEERDLPYAVGVSGRHTAHPADARPVQPVYAGTGRPPKVQYREPAQTMKDLVVAAGKAAARPVSWREGSRPGKGRSGFKRMHSRFVALRVRPAGRGIRKVADDPELPERWLLAEWPAGESEPVQFWLSNLPSGMPLATLVRLAKLRWRIEHDYREMKQALGLAHFEGRTWGGWHHHVTLVSAAHAFCTLQRLTRDPKDTALA